MKIRCNAGFADKGRGIVRIPRPFVVFAKKLTYFFIRLVFLESISIRSAVLEVDNLEQMCYNLLKERV